ncbi:hypothetical protein ACLBOM_19925 [Escherichia coli]
MPAPDLDIRIPYATDPAGNRLPDPELHPDSTLTAWPDNRIAEDAHYVYHYDEYGRLTEKTDLIPAGVIRTTTSGPTTTTTTASTVWCSTRGYSIATGWMKSRYLYDPLGRECRTGMAAGACDLTGVDVAVT